MLIDWFTVIAQVVNFIILVVLMRLFLFKPVLNVIDERKNKIAREISDADKKKSEAQKESETFKLKNEEFDKQRTHLLHKAKEDALADGQRLLDEEKKKAADFRLKQQNKLKNEAHDLNQEISRRMKQEVLSMAQKVIKDLAGTDLEKHIVKMFIRRLKALTDEKKGVLISALKMSTDSECVIIRTAFDLTLKQHSSIENVVLEILGGTTQIQFKTEPELISGIELSANGQKVSWSIADWSLETGIKELLEEKKLSEENSGVELENQTPNSGVDEHENRQS